MQWLFNEFGTGISLIILLVSAALSLYILFLVIKAAVKDGTTEQRRLLERQNELLSELLKHKP